MQKLIPACYCESVSPCAPGAHAGHQQVCVSRAAGWTLLLKRITSERKWLPHLNSSRNSKYALASRAFLTKRVGEMRYSQDKIMFCSGTSRRHFTVCLNILLQLLGLPKLLSLLAQTWVLNLLHLPVLLVALSCCCQLFVGSCSSLPPACPVPASNFA